MNDFAFKLADAENWKTRVGRRANDELFAKAFHFNPSPMIVTTVAAGIVIDVNDALCELVGSARREIIGKSVRELGVYNARERAALLAELAARKRVRRREMRFQMRDGSARQGLVNAELIEIAGEQCVLSIIVDITELRAAQTALVERNRELQRANRLKDEFLSMLSHELRTPLNAILGWTGLLINKNFDKNFDGELLRDGLDTIRRNARLQAKLIENLLKASQLAVGELELERDAIELRVVVEAAIRAAHEAAAAKKIDLQFQSVAGKTTIFADAALLEAAIFNLLENAIKFSPESVVVKVVVERQNDAARVAIIDHGIGIAPELLNSVFERFRQVDQSTTRAHNGLGLGLAIASEIVKLHGGTLTANSAGSGSGSTFTIVLPLEANDEV